MGAHSLPLPGESRLRHPAPNNRKNGGCRGPSAATGIRLSRRAPTLRCTYGWRKYLPPSTTDLRRQAGVWARCRNPEAASAEGSVIAKHRDKN